MKRTWLVFLLLFGVTTLTTLIARVPLSLALAIANPPLKAERISGTIWNGRIENAWIDGYPLGQIRVSSDFLPFFTGRISGDLDMRGGLIDGTTEFRVGRQSLRLKDGTFQAHLDMLRTKTAFGTSLEGRVDIQVPLMEFEGRRCRQGTLSMATDALQRALEPLGAKGMMLSGDGRCEEGSMVLPLAGSGPEGRADILIQIGDAGYMTELTVTPIDPNVGEALLDFGFTQNGGQFSLIERGDLPE